MTPVKFSANLAANSATGITTKKISKLSAVG
jgi:hypothetical protein